MRRAVYSSIVDFAAGRGHNDADLVVLTETVAGERPKTTDSTDAGIHLQVSTLPIAPQMMGVCNGWARYQWDVQVDVFSRDGFGEFRALEIVDALREHYPVTYEFVSWSDVFTVSRPLAVPPPVSIEGWFFFPTQLRVSHIS